MNYLIVGRPNVGKSSIFNILADKKANIIHIDEGTTRNWHKGKIRLINNCFIYDSPGIVLKSNKDEEKKIKIIIESLIPKINYILFVIEFHSTFNTIDQTIIKWLRFFNKEIILLINKKDNNIKNANSDFYKFGIHNIFFLSCAHKLGFDKLRLYLKDKSTQNFQKEESFNNQELDYSMAIFGKPNTGKSTFLNTLLGYERSLTSIESGTTSDYVIENFEYKSKNIRIVDTAGIGRKSKVNNISINYFAIQKSLEKIKEVQSAILLIDSCNSLDRQDKRIIKLLADKAKSLILVFNKIDLIKNKLHFKKNITLELEDNFHQLKNVKVFFITAFSKKQILKILDYIFKNILIRKNNLNTSRLNKWLKQCIKVNPHPMIDKKKVNFKYAVQVKNNPIIVKIFCNQSGKIKQDYIRYLKNNFNTYFKILNQNIKIIFSKSSNPYSK